MGKKNQKDYIFTKYVSPYIRMRDCDANGYGKCVSCGKLIHWKEGDAGHFLGKSGRYEAIRFEEDNLSLQCRSCNRFQEGNKAGWTIRMVDKYGKEYAEQYINNLLAMCDGPCRRTKEELDVIKEEYKIKLKRVKERVI